MDTGYQFLKAVVFWSYHISLVSELSGYSFLFVCDKMLYANCNAI